MMIDDPRFAVIVSSRERMAEKSVGRKATRRRSIEPGRIQALGETVNRSSADGVLASCMCRSAQHAVAAPHSTDKRQVRLT